jgi:hypothetical protein
MRTSLYRAPGIAAGAAARRQIRRFGSARAQGFCATPEKYFGVVSAWQARRWGERGKNLGGIRFEESVL